MASYRELYWVSHPEARHSRNIAGRPQIAMVVFDSTVAPGTGQGIYMRASAEEVVDPDARAAGVAVVSAVSVQQGEQEFTLHDITGEGRLRLYRAIVQEHSILDPASPYDVRVAVDPNRQAERTPLSTSSSQSQSLTDATARSR